MSNPPFLPYQPTRLADDEAFARGQAFYESMNERRSVRFFTDDPVPRRLIELAIRTASTAPSGAHRQPWTFVAISDPVVKKQIRVAAEREEYESYVGGRMPDDWLQAVRPMGTSWEKPYLETVPWIVVVFEQVYQIGDEGQREKNYYVKESVGLACGLLITALHVMGLSTLTHTPSPMAFLSQILQRPRNERPFILFPIGYPAADAVVPDLERKRLERVANWLEAADDA